MDYKINKIILGLILLTAPCLWGGNLYQWDTGFETGNHNFCYYDSEFPMKIVAGDGIEGKQCIEMDQRVHWPRGKWGYQVKKNRDYTISFYARRVGGADKVTFILLTSNWRHWIGRKTFQLTDKWQRFSTTFRVDQDNLPLYPAFLLTDENNPSVFRIDAMQLEEGSSATAYAPGEVVSLYPSVGDAEVVYTGKDPCMKINIYNAAAEDENFTLQILLHEKKYEKKFQLAKKESTIVEQVIAEASKPGYYPAVVKVLNSKGETIVANSAPFVVTNPFPLDRRTGFFGMQESSLPNCYLPRIGVSRLRKNIGGWKRMEPKPGKFNIPEPEKSSGKLKILSTLATEFTPGQVPEWAFVPGTRKADVKKAAAYLDKLFEKHKKVTDTIEIVNEPHLQFRNMPDGKRYYMEIVKVATPIARKHGLKVMLDTTTDPFFDEFWKNTDLFDYSSPHPYCVPQFMTNDGRYVSSPEQGHFTSEMKVMRKRAAEGKKQLVIGEVGYSTEENIPFDSPAAHRYAAYMVRMMLLARSMPECQYMIWFTGLDHQQGGPYLYGIWRTEKGIRPYPNVAAYAQAVHELDFAENIKMELDTDIKILSYRKNGKTSYAVWNASEISQDIPVRLPVDCEIRSIYGTPLKTAVIGETPFYVSENASGGVLDALKKLVADRSPLLFKGYLKNNRTLKLMISNRSFKDWKGSISINGKLEFPVVVPQSSGVTLNVDLKNTQIYGNNKIMIKSVEGKVFAEKLYLPVPLPVQYMDVKDLGTFDYRKYKFNIKQRNREDVYPPDPQIPWHSSKDLSHRTVFGWNFDYFFIFSEVRDDYHENDNPAEESWDGDSIQIGIDSFNNAAKSNYNSDDNEFTFAMGKKAWSHQGPPTRVTPSEASGVIQKITRDEKRKLTVYRLAIPRKLIAPLRLREGTVFGASFCINDKDPNEARYYMTFGNGLAEAKNPRLFKKWMLVK